MSIELDSVKLDPANAVRDRRAIMARRQYVLRWSAASPGPMGAIEWDRAK
jgi:hypothetical protein